MSVPPCPPILDPRRPDREGSDQTRRRVAALAPTSAPVDDRSLAEDLMFLREFTKHIRYYDTQNRYVDGANWQGFYEDDGSMQLALGATQSADDFRVILVATLERLKENSLPDAERKVLLTRTFRYLMHWVQQLDVFYRRLPVSQPLRVSLQNRIMRLAPYYKRLVGYYKAAESLSLVDSSEALEPLVWGERIGLLPDLIFQSTLSDAWITSVELDEVPPHAANPHQAAPWLGNVAADTSIFGAGTLAEQIYRASGHAFFTDTIYQFIQAFAGVVAECQTQLQQSLKRSDHPPHFTLILAFLRLFQYSRDHLNGIAERHLNLYYREILRLAERAPQPNHVHLLFELARQVEGDLVKKGTLVKAGKDAAGQEVLYALDEDIVVNKAAVTSLYSLYRGVPGDDLLKLSTDPEVYTNRLYSHELNPSAAATQNPFTQKTYDKGKLSTIAMQPAELGLAVASHYLYLREGSRAITLSLTTSGSGTLPADPTLHFEALLTTEKGWQPYAFNEITWTGTTLAFKITLDETIPAVIPFSQKIHPGKPYATDQPILYIRLKHVKGKPFVYGNLYQTYLLAAEIKVDVKGVRDLYVQNDFGALDPSKPFLPFGPMPRSGDGFIIGNREIFQKNAKITPQWTWKDNASVSITYQVLDQGKWVNATVNSGKLSLTDAQLIPRQAGANVPFDVYQTEGYLRAQFGGNFLSAYNTYLKEVAAALQHTDSNNKPAPLAPPSPPLPPTATSLTLDYEATTTLSLTDDSKFVNRPIQFFQVYPWGTVEHHHALTGGSVAVVPTFRHSNDGDPFFALINSEVSVFDQSEIVGDEEAVFAGETEHEAEFYIGIEGMKVPGVVNILFQLEEGTADPLVDKPRNHIHWSYLSDKGWVAFSKEKVVDRSLQLTRSGVITFSIPVEVTTSYPLFPTGKHWLRAAVATGSEGVCKLIGVHAQGVAATLTDPLLHPDFLEKPLAGSTIAKLAQPVTAIKKIAQPYESFGGRPAETSDHYYTRISERLRHKDRAVTAYDYEHLVLEAFPDLYKVKCLNHTRYESTATGSVYTELAAGHVTVVTIPNLRQRNLRNPLEPYTALDVLEEVRLFLVKRTSAFVKLHVRNPVFETVKVVGNVAFYPGFDESFYRALLAQEITQFLSPWAFSAGQELVFGGKIEKSVVINFMEERPYVDYLTDVFLLHGHDGLEENVETAVATRAISILVSASEHSLGLIPALSEEETTPSCGCG